MRSITVLALTLTLAAIGNAFPTSHHLDGYTFEQWMADAGRAYPSRDEHARRKQIFEDRLVSIKKHNANPTKTFRRGVNQFSDWTQEEFKKYNTYKNLHRNGVDITGDETVTITDTTTDGTSYTVDANVYVATGASVPGAVDYRRVTPPVLTGVKNQGHCGSCWAHSTVESIESHFAIKYGQLPVLSQQQVSACDPAMYGCGGGDTVFGWSYVMKSQGLYEEWEYPYTDFFAANESKAATSKCKDIRKEWLPKWGWFPKANVSAIWIVEPNNATATMEALALRGPLSVSVGAGDWSDYEGGIYVNPPFSNVPWEIDHAVQMVGYGHDIDMDMDYWIVRNSWGTTWGESGFIRLYRPKNEPCGYAENQTSCGTSGVLNGPGFPDATALKTLN